MPPDGRVDANRYGFELEFDPKPDGYDTHHPNSHEKRSEERLQCQNSRRSSSHRAAGCHQSPSAAAPQSRWNVTQHQSARGNVIHFKLMSTWRMKPHLGIVFID